MDDLIRTTTTFDKIKTYAPDSLKSTELEKELDTLVLENAEKIEELKKEYHSKCIKVMIGYMNDSGDFIVLASRRI